MNQPTINNNGAVHANCKFGEGVRLLGPCNVYNSELGDGVKVFNFVEIGGAKIGKNTKVSSHSYICPSVTIGEECFIGHNVSFTNDLYSDVPRYNELNELASKWTCRPTSVGDRVRIGSGSVILPVKIGDDVIIGAGSVVTKDIPSGETWCGNPARRMNQ
jgi:acetyltransferase-like isoleucine patch superfamily enzyme